MKRFLKMALNKIGVDVTRYRTIPPDFEDFHVYVIHQVGPYTLTSPERLYALIESIRYVVRNEIPGDFVECGVFKGGSIMAMCLTLIDENAMNRTLHLFDTFEGMPKPGAEDVDFRGRPAIRTFNKLKISANSSKWTNVPLETVQSNVFSTGYPKKMFHFVRGLVEDTLPANAPGQIAILRLDTDWYQSTKHELEHLYHRVSVGGIVMIDDYGHFHGARQATDEFFSFFDTPPLFNRIDYSGRLIIKPSEAGSNMIAMTSANS